MYNYLAGSTDFGNVSFRVPGIHPFFYIGTEALNHTEEYTEAAGKAARGYWEQMFLVMKLTFTAIRQFPTSSHSGPLGLSVSVLLFSFFLRQELKRPSCTAWGRPKLWLWQLWMCCAAQICFGKSERTSAWPNWDRKSDKKGAVRLWELHKIQWL